MKILRPLLIMCLSLMSYSAFASDFTLTINNNTTDEFYLTARPPKTLDNLKPGEQNKVYELDFFPDRITKQFAVLLTANTSEKASVIYEYPTIFCNPQTQYYRCSFKDLTANSVTLTISKASSN